MRTVIVCIAKDEDHYFEEWCDYHKKIGFDEIYVYENDWSCPIERDFLKKIPISGKHKQMEAYHDFTSKFRDLFDWAAFIDCDEFIVLKKHKNIQEFLTEYDNPYGIGINWQFFGPNGKMDRGDNPNSLLKQFFLKQEDTDRHVKTIMKLSSGGVMSLPHNPNTPLLGTNKEMFNGPFNPSGDISVAQLNHYHHKTYEDWLIRCNRGQADYCETRKPHQWLEQQYVFCDVEDYDAYNFMYNQ